MKSIDEIVSFLSLVHPSIDTSKYAFEIRPISREGEYLRSLNLWRFDAKSINRLKGFLNLHIDSPVCLYYSVFAFDYEREVYTKEGKKAVKGKINSNSAVYTEEIALDFDNINNVEFEELMKKFLSLGIDPLWVFSGHGYQAHILLKSPLYDKNALYKAVYKFKEKGFDVDLNCVDPARVMRLPNTYNYKGYVEERYKHEKENPPACKIIHHTDIRYDFEEIMLILDKLPSKNALTFEIEPQMEVGRIVYPYIDEYELPKPILKMLANTPYGLRNKTMGFLVKYFKTYMRLGKDQIYKICKVWANNACTEIYEEIDTDFSRFYYHNGLPYDAALASHFGYIDFKDHIQLQKQYLYLPSRVINELDGKLLKFYIAVKMLEYLEKDTSLEMIVSTLSMSERAVRDNLKLMVKTRHIYVVKGNRTKGVANRYYTNKINSLADGYLKISYNDARAYITELGIGELKLYLYMLYKFYSNECYMAQSKIGDNIGLKQNSVSENIKGLMNKDYIRVRKTFISEHIYHNTYTLLK